MRSPLATLAVACLAAMLAGCEKQPSDARALLERNPPPPDSRPEPLPPPPGREEVHTLEGARGLLKAEFPLPSCTQRVWVRLAWDVQPAGMDGAELWVGPEQDRKIISSGGPREVIAIGSWAGPGDAFTLRARGGGEEVDRVTLPGERCPDR